MLDQTSKLEPSRRRINWVNVSTVLSTAILIAAEVFGAAFAGGWAFGNLANRLAAPPNPLHLALWMSVVPPLPLLAASWAVEGPGAGWDALQAAVTPAGVPGLLAVAYIAVGAFFHFHYFWGLSERLSRFSQFTKVLSILVFLPSLLYALYRIFV